MIASLEALITDHRSRTAPATPQTPNPAALAAKQLDPTYTSATTLMKGGLGPASQRTSQDTPYATLPPFSRGSPSPQQAAPQYSNNESNGSTVRDLPILVATWLVAWRCLLLPILVATWLVDWRCVQALADRNKEMV